MHVIKKNTLSRLAIMFFSLTLIVSQPLMSKQAALKSHDARVVHHNWQDVEKMAHDAVVQVFSIVAVFDWCEPYKTPEQKGVSGSGFFIAIDDTIFIVTNAHVIDQAVALWISIPSLGKIPLRVTVKSIAFDDDLALLELDPMTQAQIRTALGGDIPYLILGDSDAIICTDEALALGYPLGQRSLKSTLGIISGYYGHRIQIDTPINPGNSGGPLFNSKGEVIGINSSQMKNAQNVNYAIPSNILKIRLVDMCNNKLVHAPWLGLVTIYGSNELAQYLGNPLPSGCFICDVKNNSVAQKAGLKQNDMIYEINGYPVDMYGDMTVSWRKDKISLHDYIVYLQLGQQVTFFVYRNGMPLELTTLLDNAYFENAAIQTKYPWYQEVDYEVFAGMVIMELTLNHIKLLGEEIPGLQLYGTLLHQSERRLIITNIFPNSNIAQQNITIGSTINEINGEHVDTLNDFRNALYKSLETQLFTIQTTDEARYMTDNVFTVLSLSEICEELNRLADLYHYSLSETVIDIVKKAEGLMQG